MKYLPTQLGAEPKKVVFLGGLVVALVVVYFINRTPDTGGSSSSSPSAASLPANPAPLRQPRQGSLNQAGSASESLVPLPPQRSTGDRRSQSASIQDFKPSLKLPEGTDAARIDPTLHLDQIAKLRDLPLEGGERSLFDFGEAPKPKTPPPSVAPIKLAPPVVSQVIPPPSATVKPGPPPIPLKFYGYVSESGVGPAGSRQAFFLNGDDIFVASENDVIQNHYKIVRIGATSAVVEDTATKNQQTLPLVEELQG